MKGRMLAAICAAACLLAPPGGATDLTYASPYSPNHTFSKADRTWMQWVLEHSGGSLRIHPIWSGGLISSDQSLLEMRHGVADIGLITPIYSLGGTHLLRTQAGFYIGAKTFEQQLAMYRCLADASPQYARELDGLKVLAIQGGTLPGLLTRTREVRTLRDLQGLRIRVPTELLEVMRDLGVDPVSMPMGEVYSSLAKGVLDGVVAPADTLKSLHFGEIAKFYTELEVPRGAYPGRAMSERRWRSLSAEDQAVLSASVPVWEAALSAEIQAAVRSGMAEGRAQGVHFVPIAPEEQQRFDDLYEKDAAVSARALGRFDIDGIGVFEHARKIAQSIARTGTVTCTRTPDAAT
jgi:TRAP-type transport system periplasmic protein